MNNRKICIHPNHTHERDYHHALNYCIECRNVWSDLDELTPSYENGKKMN